MPSIPSFGRVRRVRVAAIRWPVAVPAMIASSALRARAVEVADLSRTGCRVRVCCRFAEGERVSLRLATLAPIGARVVSSDGVSTELVFASGLGPCLLELLVARHRRPGDVLF